MLTEHEFESIINELIEMYANIEYDLIGNIAKRLKYTEEITPTVEWLMDKLKEIGALNDESIEIIAKYSNKTKEQLKLIFDKVGYNCLPSVSQIEAFKQSPIIKNLIDFAYQESYNNFVRINQSILENVKTEYTNIINQVFLETATGIYDYQSSLRKAMDNMANKGITIATYQSIDSEGNIVLRKYGIEGIIRRDLMTQTHQLAGNVNQASIEELDPPYIKITEHLNCREQHIDWQGCYIKPQDLIAVTDYGSITGLEGINCRHLHFAYFGEVDERKYRYVNGIKIFTQDKNIPDEEAKAHYKLEQKQRYIERAIRKYKRRKEASGKIKNEEGYIKAQHKVSEWQKIMREFIKKYPELDRQYIRERI